MGALTWIEATPGDEDAVFALLEAFYEEEHITLRREETRAALRTLLREPRAGRVFLLKNEAAPDAEKPAGYIVTAFWHSLEFGGRVVVLDELYLAPDARGRGLGRESLAFVRAWAKTQGAAAVRLEVNHHNTHAKAVYLKAGFADDRRDIMTVML